MYKLIPAQEKHLDQIAKYIAMTGYHDVSLKGNILNLSTHEFTYKFIAKPCLSITTVAVKENDEDKIYGVIICTNKENLSKLPDFLQYLDPEILQLFQNFIQFEISDSYHILHLAVSKDARGKGIGKKLFEFAEQESKKEGHSTISLIVVNCQTDAIRLYLKMGMMITKSITVSEKVPFNEFLYMEKNPKIMYSHNYFEKPSCKKATLL